MNPPVDIAALAARKDPRWGKFPRSPLIALLRRLIREKEVNSLCLRFEKSRGIAFIDPVLRDLDVRAEVRGVDRLPEEERILFVANHPLGGIDALLILRLLSSRYPSIRVFANALLLHIPQLREVILPIHPGGKENINVMGSAYKGRDTLLTFPAGLCSRRKGGIITDPPWRSSFVGMARRYRRLIVPLYFEGKNSGLFYRCAALRERVGIRNNYEGVLLAREVFNKRSQTFRIRVGSPIDPTGFPKLTDRELSGRIREDVYALAASDTAITPQTYPEDYPVLSPA